MADDEPKIIIDEGWKAQVQREKEQVRQTSENKQEGAAEEQKSETPARPEEADFAMLVQSLATQCLFALGAIAPQDAKQVTVDLGQAKYVIDTLLMLRQKTKGNLSSEEEGFLSEAISELQRIYVMRAQQAQESALRKSGIDPAALRNPGGPKGS